jgi:hypothetical protein
VSYLWTQEVDKREKVDVSLVKEGKGVMLTFGPKVDESLRLGQFPVRYRVELVQGWSVVFGGQPTQTDRELA